MAVYGCIYDCVTLFTWYGHKNLVDTVLTAAVSDLALWTLRNPETAQFFECLILQVKGSLGLPRNKRTVVPLFTFYLKLWTVRQEYDSLKVEAMCGKFGKSTRAKVLWTGQLIQADPSMVKVQVRSHYQMCVGGGGYVAGKTQEVRWLGQGGTHQSSAKYRAATNLPATKNKWQILDQEVYEFGTWVNKPLYFFLLSFCR